MSYKEVSTPIICIMGATGSGKTDLALNLAERIPCEIISVDSAMIYRGMDIGTAKPSLAELKCVKHHLVDIINPDEAFSVASFLDLTNKAIVSALHKGKYPVLVGGTMMYFNALFNGLHDIPSSCPDVRNKVALELESNSLGYMYDKLRSVDPVYSAKIHANDTQRILRALEVYYSSGRIMSNILKSKVEKNNWNFKKFNVVFDDRGELHQRIEARLKNMIDNGFVSEVESLRENYDLNNSHSSYRCVGYKQCFQYLQGEFGKEEMIQRSLFATRQLAKRQLTWLRGLGDLTLLNFFYKNNIDVILNQI